MNKLKTLLTIAGLAAALGAGGLLWLSDADAGVVAETVDGMALNQLEDQADPVVEEAEPAAMTAQEVQNIIAELRKPPSQRQSILKIARQFDRHPRDIKAIDAARKAQVRKLQEQQ